MLRLLCSFIALFQLALASSRFYQVSDGEITTEDVLMTINNVHTKTECVLQCKRQEQCKDVALKDGGKCLLLKNDTHSSNSSIGASLGNVKIIKIFQEPYGMHVLDFF